MGNSKISPGVAVIIIVIAVILVLWQFVFKPKGPPQVSVPTSTNTTAGNVYPGGGGMQPGKLAMPPGKNK